MMSTDGDPTSTLVAALNAYDSGLCIVRAAVDGTKRPLGEWKQYQAQRPTREQIIEWFTDGHPGMGVVCGAVSGDLEMFELEGRFMAADGSTRFATAMRDAGLLLLLKRLASGYQTVSPSGGRHFLYRVAGAIEGNTKLARDDNGETIIETRGEGGFVVLAPSSGPVHPTGKPWATKAGTFASIPTITTEEREAMFAVARSFNTAPPVLPPAPPSPDRRTQLARWDQPAVGDSYMDAVVDHLKATDSARDALERHGWVYCYSDRHGRQLMRRPGKDEGVSGSINNNGRLVVFSTSTPFDADTTNARPTSYDALDIIAMYEYGGDRKAAARQIAQQTGIYEAWQARGSTLLGAPTKAAPPANVNPETGEIITTPTPATGWANLPESFWQARPSLAHIRQAAHAQTRSADAVLCFSLARIAALIPPTVKLPAIVGSPASLNFLGATIGTSGAGKSSAGTVAKQLVPIDRTDVLADIPLGSGEGLIELYFETVKEEQPDGKFKPVKRQVRSGAYLYLDEGQALGEMGNRKGATLLPTLRAAWVGATLGQANASQETYRVLPEHRYRLALMVGFQLEHATGLLDDAAGGTPQRFVFAAANDPSIPDTQPEWPGPLDIHIPPLIGNEQYVEVEPTVADEIRQRNLLQSRGTIVADDLDSHRDLSRLKVAALLGVIEGRYSVTCHDWHLAGEILRTSVAVRTWIAEAARQRAAAEEQRRNRVAASREVAIFDTLELKALNSAARSVANRVWRDGGDAVPKRDAQRAIAGKHRAVVSVDEVVAEAVRLQWIQTPDGGETWLPGKARPA